MPGFDLQTEDFEGDDALTKKIDALKARFGNLEPDTVQYEAGEIILVEGTPNDHVLVIVSGQVDMLKHSTETAHNMQIDSFGPGDLIGLTSFWTRQPSFLESRAKTVTTCLRFNATDFEKLVETNTVLREAIHQLFISNLSNRYRRMISLNVEVAELSEKLEIEHRNLKAAMEELKQTRTRLINQEKLATLGQLIAGIAHEINNPCAALTQGIDRLTHNIPNLLKLEKRPDNLRLEADFLQAGADCPYWAAEEIRKRMKEISKQYPDLKRSVVRKLSQLEHQSFQTIAQEVGFNNTSRVNQLLDCFEIGASLRSSRIAANRIQALVISLKNYGNQDHEAWKTADLREGIRDTLMVLNNRLRNFNLQLDLQDIKPTYCIAGEMNQVWTNLLVNASQATPIGGTITVTSRQENQEIIITVTDSGAGIREDVMGRIFEANFTTKSTKSDFGLGLGLAISKDIVEKHGGTITAENAPEAGARFTVRLPVEKE